MFTFILTNIEDHILTITLNREKQLNALNAQLLQEVKSAVLDGIKDEDVHGIILTGTGDKAFAAGADIKEFADFDPDNGKNLSAQGHEVMNTIENSPKIIIAAVKGYALGGGCELAMSCHMRVAGENAKFGQPEVNLGLPPGYGATQRLIQLIGKSKAIELLTTADIIGAEEALSLGLTNHVVPVDEVISKSKSIVQKIAKKSPQAISMVLDCVNQYFHIDKDGMKREIELFGQSFQSKEFNEGTRAFMEKRKADFRNRR